MIPMTADQVTEIINSNKGELATITISGSTPTGPSVVGTVTGTIISINSKGVNLKVADGTTVSRSLSRVVWVKLDGDDIEVAAAEDGIANLDLPNDQDALVAELDGATTAELADVFGIAAKELRVTLRSLGMGVGKGRRYHLTADQINTVRTALTPTA